MKKNDETPQDTIIKISRIRKHMEREEYIENLDFVAQTAINDIKTINNTNDFQCEYFKNSLNSLLKMIQEKYPEDFSKNKILIVNTLLEFILPDQDINFITLLDSFIDKKIFNPLVFSNLPSLNDSKYKNYHYSSRANELPDIMKALSHHKANLAFILDYAEFFNCQFESKPNILFGKEKFSQQNILLKQENFSTFEWWEFSHLYNYNVDFFNKISYEDFFEQQKNKYFDEIKKKNKTNEIHETEKSILEIILEPTLKKLYSSVSSSFLTETENKELIDNIDNIFLDYINNNEKLSHLLETQEDKIKKKYKELEDSQLLNSTAIIKEVLMISLVMKFPLSKINEHKEQLESLNLYPTKEEYEQILFILTNPDFINKNNEKIFFKDNIDLLFSIPELRKQSLYFLTKNVYYNKENINLFTSSKYKLTDEEFENWHYHFFSDFLQNQSKHFSNKQEIIESFESNCWRYFEILEKMVKHCGKVFPNNEIKKNIEKEIDYYTKQKNEINRICTKEDLKPSLDKIYSKIETFILHSNISQPHKEEELSISKKRL